MKWGSLRLRLTLWNLAVLAVTLTAFGLLLVLFSGNRMTAEVDKELTTRGRRFLISPPPQPRRMPEPRAPIQGPPEKRTQTAQANQNYDPLGFIRLPQFYSAQGRYNGPDMHAPPFDLEAVQAALKGRNGLTTSVVHNAPIRVYTVAMRNPDGRVAGVGQVARDLTDIQKAQSEMLAHLLLLLPIALVAAGAGALFLTNRALRPIAEVTQTASEISAHDLSRRLEVSGNDELADLARTFNGMIGRLQLSFTELEGAYRELQNAYEAHRRFTADASHELRTPLTRLRLATTSALSGSPNEQQEALRIADTAGEYMSRLVQQLLVLSQADAGNLRMNLQPIDLRVVAAETFDMIPCKDGVQCSVVLPDQQVSVEGDEDHLRRVIINLVENALRHTPEGGAVTLRVQEQGEQAMIVVEDTGEGIPEEHQAHIFDRFYRVDAARSREDGGMGLGLSICKSIIEAHHGEIHLCSEPGRGTRVTASLPLTK